MMIARSPLDDLNKPLLSTVASGGAGIGGAQLAPVVSKTPVVSGSGIGAALPIPPTTTGGSTGGIGSVAGTPTPTPRPTPTPTTPPVPTVPPPVVTPPVTTPTPAPVTPTTAGFNSDGSYTPQNDSVINQVNSVISSNSPLMERAQGIGMAVANARGLQNSTLAAQSAEKSLLDAAVPIASQEAQQIYGKNLESMQLQTQKQIAQMQVDSNMSVTQLQTAAQTQTAFSAALLSASQSYSANVSAIMQNPDLDAASRSAALASAATQRDADFAMIQKVYGVSIAAPSTSSTGAGTGSTTTTPSSSTLSWGSTPTAAAA